MRKMPFIGTKTNVTIPKEKEEILKEKFGKAIECIPGKTESWLMLGFEDGCHMYFRGNGEEPMAFLEVKVYGKAEDADCGKLTGVLTGILEEELGIASDHIYIKYEEVDKWGWNGGNF